MLEHLPTGFLPILLVALGGLVSELAGVLNISVEGLMLLGSLCGVAGFGAGLGQLPAMLIALVAGGVFGLLLGFLTVRLGANVFIAGLGVNLVAAGLVTVLGQLLFHSKGTINIIGFDRMSNLPVQLAFAGLVLVLLIFSYSYSLIGIRFRSLSNHAEMLYARGVKVRSYQIGALAVSGALACLGGAFLSQSIGAFVPEGTTGKGWIALVLVYAGARHPLGVLLACGAFVAAEEASIALQGSLEHPGIAVGLPYLAVLAALVIVQLATGKRFNL